MDWNDRRLIFGITASWALFMVVVIVLVFVFVFPLDSGEPRVAFQPSPTSTPSIAAKLGLTPAELRALGLDVLPSVTLPPDNPFTDKKAELGKLLFFDRRLSGNGLVSCATCHSANKGWGDGNAVSLGYPGTLHWRNSQTIINSAYLAKLFWGGESLSLEAQAKSAWTGAVAQNLDTDMAEEQLRQIPEYVRRFRDTGGRSMY